MSASALLTVPSPRATDVDSNASSAYNSDADEPTLKDVLALYTLEEIVGAQADRAVLLESTTVPDALQIMNKENAHVLPVGDGKHITGYMDLTRIVRSIVASLNEKDAVFDAKDFDVAEFREVVGEENYSKATVNDVKIEFSDSEEGGFIYHISTPLHYAVYTMSYGQHRFPLVGENGTFYGFWKQSSVARVISAHIDDLGEMLQTPVKALKPNLKTVVQISVHDKLVRAFRTSELNHWECSGIAVLDGVRLVGNISSPDLRLVASDVPNSFANLYLTAGEYLAKLYATYPETRQKMITVTTDATFADVVKIFAEEKMFRIYVVDEVGILVGVVRLSDILEALLPPAVPNQKKAE